MDRQCVLRVLRMLVSDSDESVSLNLPYSVAGAVPGVSHRRYLFRQRGQRLSAATVLGAVSHEQGHEVNAYEGAAAWRSGDRMRQPSLRRWYRNGCGRHCMTHGQRCHTRSLGGRLFRPTLNSCPHAQTYTHCDRHKPSYETAASSMKALRHSRPPHPRMPMAPRCYEIMRPRNSFRKLFRICAMCDAGRQIHLPM